MNEPIFRDYNSLEQGELIDLHKVISYKIKDKDCTSNFSITIPYTKDYYTMASIILDEVSKSTRALINQINLDNDNKGIN